MRITIDTRGQTVEFADLEETPPASTRGDSPRITSRHDVFASWHLLDDHPAAAVLLRHLPPAALTVAGAAIAAARQAQIEGRLL